MGEQARVTPQILVPYPGPDGSGDVHDIFVYLRPETNGVLVESALLKVVQNCSQYRSSIRLVYLANFPGQFIVDNHIVERHYAHKFYFAVHGKRVFTRHMIDEFERHFGVPFAAARVIGSFEALQELGESPDQLFTQWVPAGDLLHVDGQSIKRLAGVFVVNYDIPALLHKNTRSTDIAVMLFRCSVDYDYFQKLVDQMREALIENKTLPERLPASRAFHYSKGPFEQLLDASDYLRRPAGDAIDLRELSFVRYAAEHGYTGDQLMSLVRNPICVFEQSPGEYVEESIFTYTSTDSYPEAITKLASLRSQVWIH